MNTEAENSNTAVIRQLNDRFRQDGIGQGSVMVTYGVYTLGDEFVASVVAAVREFDSFNTDNDPHGEHDFGAVMVDGEKIFFKIDYYDLSRTAHSPNPADESVTRRVLTIMSAAEY